MIETALIVALIVYFIKVSTWPGMIFEKPAKAVEDMLGEYWSKPVIGCPVCMTPWWGAAVYVIGHYAGVELFEPWEPLHIIYVLFAASGITSVILMFNKDYDVAKKEDKILKEEIKEKGIE